jgi:hypothetical protein
MILSSPTLALFAFPVMAQSLAKALKLGSMAKANGNKKKWNEPAGKS